MKENKEAKITVRVYEEDKEMLKAIAEKKDVPISQIIRKLIEEYIEKENKLKIPQP